MICLDTNYLIMGLVAGSREAGLLLEWASKGEKLITSSIVWYEFLCGPVTDQHVAAMKQLLAQIAPFDESTSNIASQLFNQAGRKRTLRVDAMIAATAIAQQSPLATNNTNDFSPFVPFGLELVTVQ